MVRPRDIVLGVAIAIDRCSARGCVHVHDHSLPRNGAMQRVISGTCAHLAVLAGVACALRWTVTGRRAVATDSATCRTVVRPRLSPLSWPGARWPGIAVAVFCVVGSTAALAQACAAS